MVRVVEGLAVEGRQRPTVGCAHDEAALLEGAERLAEASVVDAELTTERGPGSWLAGAVERVAHGVGEGRRRAVVAVVDLEPGGLTVATGEREQDGLWGGRGPVFDGEA